MSIRCIHVGVGGRGRWPVKLISDREDFETAALVDVSEENLAAARQVSGLGEDACFNDMAEAIRSVEADAVIVITPPDMHAGQCLEAARAGKHVLVEKPFTKSLAAAREVIGAANEAGAKVAVCQNARYVAPVWTFHKLASEGSLGKPEFGLMTKFGWRPGTHHSGRDEDAYLWERGIHDFDAANFMMNSKPKRISCHGFNPSWSPYRGGSGIHAWIEYENGASFGFLCTFASRAGGSELRIDFEGGTVQQNGKELQLTRPDAKEPEAVAPAEHEAPETILLNGFAAYINDETEPSFSGPRNLETVGTIECLAASSERGQVLDFEAFMQE